jgi:hypothetical protein
VYKKRVHVGFPDSVEKLPRSCVSPSGTLAQLPVGTAPCRWTK